MFKTRSIILFILAYNSYNIIISFIFTFNLDVKMYLIINKDTYDEFEPYVKVSISFVDGPYG